MIVHDFWWILAHQNTYPKQDILLQDCAIHLDHVLPGPMFLRQLGGYLLASVNRSTIAAFLDKSQVHLRLLLQQFESVVATGPFAAHLPLPGLDAIHHQNGRPVSKTCHSSRPPISVDGECSMVSELNLRCQNQQTVRGKTLVHRSTIF